MPNSYKTYTGNGSTTNYPITEIDGWISGGFLKIYLNDVLQTTGYTLNDLTTASPYVLFTTAPASGVNIKIQRETPSTVAGFQGSIVNFNNGSVLTEADLDNMAKGLLHITQEAEDTGSGALGPSVDFVSWDAKNKKIINLVAPTNEKDAANKGYVDGLTLYGEPIATPQIWNFTTTTATNYTLSPASVTTDSSMFVVTLDGLSLRPGNDFSLSSLSVISLVTAPTAGQVLCVRNFGAVRNIASFNGGVTFYNLTEHFGGLDATSLTTTSANVGEYLEVGGEAGLNTFYITGGDTDSALDTKSIFIGPNKSAYAQADGLNTVVGFGAMNSLTTGAANTAIGASALPVSTTGTSNTAVGRSALAVSVTTSNNTSVGVETLAALTTGNNNTALGYNAGRYASGGAAAASISNGVFVGYNTRPNTTTSTNEICIGYNAIGGGSNTSTIGNSSTTAAQIWGTLTTTGTLNVSGAGTSTFAGNASVTGNVSVTGNLGVTGSFTAPAASWPQCKMTHSITPTTYATAAGGTRAGAVKIAAMDTSITPRTASSKILVTYTLNCEANQESMFYLIRRVGGAGTEIGSAAAASNRTYGFCVAPADADGTQTQAIVAKSYLDSPNTTSSVTYELWWYAPVASSQNIHLNRTANDSDNSNNERGTSQCILQEYFA
jgi:hypothetical protein